MSDDRKHPREDESEDSEDPGQFSSDPGEQMRIANELLRLKLQAETGVNMEAFSEVPPEVENAFLNHILAFERQLDTAEEKSIFEILGKPSGFKKETELTDQIINQELQRLEELMASRNIEVDYGTNYPDRLKYKFITEELFEHKTSQFELPNMVSHFIYEEFHPNHHLSIEDISQAFLNAWLDQNLEDASDNLAQEWHIPGGRILNQEEVKQKINQIFEAYLRFENGRFNIEDLSFEVAKDNEYPDPGGTGQVNGSIGYDAVLESGESKNVSGDFMLNMELNADSWEITFAEMPDLRWSFC